MKEGGIGGGNTITGLNFEKKTDILSLLRSKKGYKVVKNIIYYKGKEVAKSFKKNGLYKFLETKGVDYTKILSKKLLPDEAIYVIVNNTLFIIEVKFQKVAGSVDEKFPFMIENIQTRYPCPAMVVYGGGGAKPGAVKYLKSQVGGNLVAVFSHEEFLAWVIRNL